MAWHSAWTLPAMLPGKRCRAGGVRNTVASASASIAAILRGIEVPDPLLQLGRAAERLLDGDLLVEREPDEQGERFGDEEPVGIRVAGERERGERRHARMVVPDC